MTETSLPRWLSLVQGMDKLTKQSDLQQAQELMGKQVTAVRSVTDGSNAAGSTVTGVVSRLSIRNGEYYIGIKEANGGIVDVTMSSLQSVTPKSQVSQYANLVGKDVSGTVMKDNTSTPVIGTVQGVSDNGNGVVLQVKLADGSIVELPVDRIDNIAATA